MNKILFTIGHSNHSIETFISLLQQHGIDAVADVRSHPVSSHCPQFSRDLLEKSLKQAGMAYVFLGKELGARSENPDCYRKGKVQYDLLAKEPDFQKGLDRLLRGMERYRIAVMCSEKDPLFCHRSVLVSRKIFENGIGIRHILADGNLESQEEMESRMLAFLKVPEKDMFRNRTQCVNDAYSIQADRIAFQDESLDETKEAVGQ